MLARRHPARAPRPVIPWLAQFPLNNNGQSGEEDRDDKSDAHTIDDPELIDQYSAKDRGDHDRQSFDDHLNAYPHRMATGFKRGANERKRGRQRKTRPGKEKEHTRDHSAPMWNKQYNGVPDD